MRKTDQKRLKHTDYEFQEVDIILKPKFKKESNDFIFANLKRRCSIAMLLVIVFVFSITTAYAAPKLNNVKIEVDEKVISVRIGDVTVEKALLDENIKLSEYDEITPDVNSYVYHGMEIKIKRMHKVNLICDGFNVSYLTGAKTYREFLDENHIALSASDSTSEHLDTVLGADNTLKITRVQKFSGEVSEEIPYTTRKYEDPYLEKGKTKLVQQGQNGVKKIKCDIVYNNGVEVSRNVKGEYVSKRAIDEIVAVGTATGKLATVGADTFSYKKVLTCSATAYDLSFQSTGKMPGHPAYGITATGTYAKLGTVAVDPRVIPLGTKMYIVSTDGSVVYGYCTAEDTGGAIKGNKVDLFYNTTAECMQFGRRSVYVYIL